jgi:hypothetical protein
LGPIEINTLSADCKSEFDAYVDSTRLSVGPIHHRRRRKFSAQVIHLIDLFSFYSIRYGRDREFKVFKWLEGGVCTMCAPGDQRKSSGNKSEQAEPNELQCQRRPMFRAAVISYARIGEVDRCPEFNSRNWAAMEWLLLGGGFIRQNGQVG